MALIELRGVSKIYHLGGEEIRALDNVDLDIHGGEFISIIGPSGSGKSTLMHILGCLDSPSKGSIKLDGTEIATAGPRELARIRNQKIGFVFQFFNLLPRTSALNQVALPVLYASGDDPEGRAKKLLERVGMSSRIHHLPNQLSGGQQQRVALARALAFEPEILLLDEPLSALDAQVRIQIREEIRRIQLDFGITTVFVTHDQEEAMAISDRVAVMNHGKLEQIDSPSKLYNSPQTSFVAGFVGSANQLPGELDSSGSVRVLKQRVGISKFSEHLGKGSRVTVLVRPEDLKVVSQREDNATHGVVSLKSFLGPNSTLGVSVGDLPLIHLLIDSKDSKNINVGDEISFVIKADDVMVKAVE